MIKIAHFGDVHWRSLTRHEEYRKSFEDAFEKMRVLKPDYILIAGDIVHSKTQGISPELISNLTWWFREMSKIAEVHVTLGNHDGLILNPDREDAITPIVNAIDDNNIKLYKKSGIYPLTKDYNLCVFSCFDEDGWESVKPENGKTNIATFHGPVNGSHTDENWNLEGSVNVSFFDGFDYILLGDIHKQQFITPRMAYCGSTIQQNYGELPGKGFLFWAIEGQDFKSKHIPVAHDFPFVTLEYENDIDAIQTQAETYPEKSRFRIRVKDSVNQAERTQIRAAIKSVSTPSEIVFKSETDEVSNQISETILEDNETLSDAVSVWKLVQDYYSESELEQKTLDRMQRALMQAWGKAEIDEDVASGRWSVKKIEFDNVFGYGEDNVVNFESTSGITGIFGKNRSGKSSICGALTYALFNGTDRGPMKNIHVVNARKNHCKVRAVVSKKGNNMLVERQTVKRTNRKGQVSAATHLNLFECDDTGTPIRDLSDEQRRQTEKILRSHIGTLDDFLMTSLASQGDINRFVKKGSAERKAILAKFLRLDILENLQKVLKTELSVAKATLAKIPEKEFDTQIFDKKSQIIARKSDRQNAQETIAKISEILSAIDSALKSDSDQQYTDLEVADQENLVAEISNSLEDVSGNLQTFSIEKETLESRLTEVLDKLQEHDYKALREAKVQIDDTERNLLIAGNKVDQQTSELKASKKEVKRLNDVPCGYTFPMCKYIVSARKAENSLLEKQENLKSVKKHVSALKSELKKLVAKNVDEKLAEKSKLDQKVNHLKQEIAKNELAVLKAETRKKQLENRKSEAQALLDTMKMNMCDEETAEQRKTLIEKRKKAEQKLQEAQKKVQFLSEKIGLLTAEVEQLGKDKKSYEENNFHHNAINLLHKSLGRDGIPLQIVKKKLPIINHEIANILTGVTGFTVELESDDKGMDIILDYGDSRRVIEVCSGMEKMMASLAIRTALIRVSSLPKSDTLIIDEGFGALDASNIEACTSLLRSLTKTFRSIIIISHVDTVKDVVDNVIEISTDNRHDSKVTFL